MYRFWNKKYPVSDAKNCGERNILGKIIFEKDIPYFDPNLG